LIRGQSPSSGRSRKAAILPSISSHSRLTWLFEMPLIPIAFTSSPEQVRGPTERVETPWTYASWTTAASAFSAIRRGSRKPGK
jgi:hypothetical protein